MITKNYQKRFSVNFWKGSYTFSEIKVVMYYVK